MQNVLHLLGPEHTGHFVQPHVAAHCGGDIYSRRKPLFWRATLQFVAQVSDRLWLVPATDRAFAYITYMSAATCRPSVSATMRGHMWLNKVASVLGPLF